MQYWSCGARAFSFMLVFLVSVTLSLAEAVGNVAPFLRSAGTTHSGVQGLHLVKLRRRGERRGAPGAGSDGAAAGALATAGAAERSFYVGRISLGGFQKKVEVAFDTACGQIVLPSWRCRSAACRWRRRYTPGPAARDINADGTPIQENQNWLRSPDRESLTIGFSNMDLGDGRVTGDLVRDTVCVSDLGGQQTCAEMGMVIATEMTDAPFGLMPHDGTVGLGLHALSINSLFNFFGQLSSGSKALKPQFGIFLGAKGGEIAFGGHNPARLASPLAWAPVLRPEEGFWQVRIRAVRVGNRTLEACRGRSACHGIVDTGSSRVGVPRALAPEVLAALAARGEGGACLGEDLHLDLEGGLALTLRREDYGLGAACAAQLATLDLPKEMSGAFILGEALLRRYYAVFDSEQGRVGFGLAAAPGEEEEAEDEGELAAVFDEKELEAAAVWSNARAHQQLASMDTYSVLAFVLQALVMQSVVVLLVSLARSYIKSLQMLFVRASSRLARAGLLSESCLLLAPVPPRDALEADDCVICLGSCEEKYCKGGCKQRPSWSRLRCGHQFHDECIVEWLWKVQRCPVCRCDLFDTKITRWIRDPGSPNADGVAAPPVPSGL